MIEWGTHNLDAGEVTLEAVVLCVLFAVTTMNAIAIPPARIEIAAQTSIACSTQKNKWKNAFAKWVM